MALGAGWALGRYLPTAEPPPSPVKSPAIAPPSVPPAERSRPAREATTVVDAGVPASAVAAPPLNTMAAVRAALREEHPLDRMAALAAALRHLTPEAAPALFALLEAQPDGFNRMRELSALMFAWGEVDPEAALDAASSLGDRRDRMMLLMAGVAGWSYTDPTAARVWVTGQESAGFFDPLTLGLLGGWARQDPVGAARWLASEPDRLDRRTAATVVREGLTRDPASLLAWAKQLPPGSARDAFIGEATRQLAALDPADALAWIDSLPPAEQIAATADALGRWAREDPVAAGDWLGAQPPGPGTDEAMAAYARSLSREYPREAVAWAAAIGDDTLRQNTVTRTGAAFYHRDPDGFAAWAVETGLDDATRAAIEQSDPPRRGPPRP